MHMCSTKHDLLCMLTVQFVLEDTARSKSDFVGR